MGLGRNVGKLIKARGLSYGAVARGIGIEDNQAIWALVKRDSKKSDFAAKLAEFFRVPLVRLLADDFEVDEPLAVLEPAATYSAKIKAGRVIRKGGGVLPMGDDAKKLLVVIRTFLDTDAEGREELLKAAVSVSQAHGATATPNQRRAKRR